MLPHQLAGNPKVTRNLHVFTGPVERFPGYSVLLSLGGSHAARLNRLANMLPPPVYVTHPNLSGMTQFHSRSHLAAGSADPKGMGAMRSVRATEGLVFTAWP